MAQPTIQTAFASGEWAPKLRSRVDLQKYKVGAALLRNFFVDWAGGGASTRQGTKFLAQTGANGARLIPFQPSATVSYVLEFGDGYIRFYSNGARIETSPGVAYQISSPFAASDLFPNPTTGNPGIKYVQDVTSMIICHPSYPPQILTINAPTNWTITSINFGATIGTPTGLSLVTNLAVLASGWNYAYTVTAVDVNGQESIPAAPQVLTGFQNLQTVGSTNTTGASNTLSWSTVTGAASYNVYKAAPQFNVTIPVGALYGFIGNTTATSFSDTTPGFSADFAQTPPVAENPFQGAGVQNYTVTTAGTYTTVPGVTIGSPPAGGSQATAQAQLGIISFVLTFGGSNYHLGTYNLVRSSVVYGTFKVTATSFFNGPITAGVIVWAGSITSGNTPTNPLSIQGAGGSGDATINATWGVTAVNSIQSGAGYTSAPSVTFSAGAAAATANLNPVTGGNPGVPGFIQERLVLAGKINDVQGFDFSQPASFFNFNVSFPVEASDAISGDIIAEDLNVIKALVVVPTGMLALTGKAGWLLNGGSGISTTDPITPTNIVAQPQAYHGSSDIKPIKINMDILYVTNKGQYVRDLAYNIYMQIFTGSDITTLSTHLFQGSNIVDWCWCEEPLKTVWAVRSDGVMLSLAYVKEQELVGWAHHDTNGQFKSCCAVVETIPNGEVVDAVYMIVERTINGAVVQYVERLADRYFTYGYEDSWSVDCALQTTPNSSPPGLLSITGNASTVGNSVTLTDTADAPFTAPMAAGNWIVRAGGGIYKITGFTSTSVVAATIVRVPTQLNPYTNTAFNVVGFQIWQPITSVSGLTQLLNTAVTGVADGSVISGTVDGSGNLALGGTFTKVTLGLAFTPQLQTLPLDLGEPTVQSKRKKVPAATMRVTDTLGLQVGTSFANAVTMKDFQIGAIPTQSNGPALVTDLFSGDGRQILDQVWQEVGQLVIQQNLPYPATVLGIMPEVVVGDSANAGAGR